MDARLQLPASSISYLLQKWAQALAVALLFDHVAQVVAKILGLSLGVSALERMKRGVAEATDDFSAQTPAQALGGGGLFVVSADGKGVPMRKAAEHAASYEVEDWPMKRAA